MFIAFSSKLQVSKVLETFRFDHLDLFASPFLMISFVARFFYVNDNNTGGQIIPAQELNCIVENCSTKQAGALECRLRGHVKT